MLSNMISSHVRISYCFYQFVTTRYTTDFYMIIDLNICLGRTPIWKGQGCSLCMYLLAVKKAVLVLLRMFSLKRSTAGTFIVPCRVLSRNKITGNYVLFKGTFLWDDLDQDRWSKITRIVVHQRNRWIHDQSGFIGSFDAPWSEWSWITDPDPDHPKGMHP